MFEIFNKNNGSSFLDRLLVSAIWLPSYSRICQYLLVILSEIQVIDVLLYVQFKLILADDDSSFKKILLKISAVCPTDFYTFDSQSSNNNPLLIMTWFYFLIFLLIFGSILKSFYLKKEISSRQANCFTFLGQLHLSMGFWITNMILLDSFSRNDIVFEKSNTIFLADILSLVLIFLNYVIGAFYAIFSYNPFIGSSIFSTHVPIFQIQTFVFKAITPIIVTWFDNSSAMPWVFTIISFIITVIRHYSLILNFPYYEYTSMKTTVITSASSVLVSSMSLFISATQTYSGNFFGFTEVLLVFFMVMITLNRFEATIKRYCTLDFQNLKSQREVLKKIFALRCLFEKIRMNVCNDRKLILSELEFWGAFASIRRQIDVLPLSASSNAITSETTLEDFRKYHSKTRDLVIKGYLKMAIERLKHTNKLKMFLCYLSLQGQHQVDTPVHYLTTITKVNGLSRIVTLNLRKQVQKVIDKFLTDDSEEEKKLDIRSYMDLEFISVTFNQMIYSNSKKSIEFWAAYSKQSPRVKELYDLNIKIEKGYDHITRFWKSDIDPNKVFVKSLCPIYSIYLNLVRNAPSLSKKVFDKYNTTLSNLTQNSDKGGQLSESNLESPYNITLYASASKERVGAVLYISPNAADLLGWAQDDLKGTNINTLIPSFMQKGHDLIVMQHLKNVSNGFTSKRLYKNVMTFVRDKDGYIIPCCIYLSIYPYIQQELIYAGMIRLKQSRSNVILVDEKGGIHGFSKRIGELLGLKINKSFKISDICENYKLVEIVLYNLHQLMIQKLAKDLKEVRLRDLPTSDEILRIQMEEAFDDLNQTIQLKFHSLGVDCNKNPEALKSFSVKITGKKLWDCYFFVLKLTLTSSKVINIKRKVEKNIFKVTEERDSNYEDSYSNPVHAILPLRRASQALLKAAITATNIKIFEMKTKKVDVSEHVRSSQLLGPSVESIALLDSAESPSQPHNKKGNIQKRQNSQIFWGEGELVSPLF